MPGSNTVLRASYGRTLETPYNENLLLSSGVGTERPVRRRPDPRARAAQPGGGRHPAGARQLGRRRLRLLQQAHRQRLRLRRAVRHADRVPGRVGSLEDRRLHGHGQPRRARRLQRVRRDGAHQRDLFAAGQRRHPAGARRAATSGSITIRSSTRRRTCSTCSTSRSAPGRALSWRYDSGLVAGAVGEHRRRARADGDQQAAIGFFCGSDGRHARRADYRAARRVAAPRGCESRPTAPKTTWTTRRESRRGICSIWASAPTTCSTADRAKVRVRFSVVNLTNKEALYNFLSTFSGTHFVTPRAYQVQVGVGF